MMDHQELNNCLHTMQKDNRLNVWHVSILVALFLISMKQGRRDQVKVSRSKIMALSHINTLPTYHKYFKELQELGYIRYRPSYHPGVRSEIDLLKQP
jgi:hypothetical protein